MAEVPKCKNHPTVDAELRKDGVSTGLCKECLTARANKAAEARAANK